jgi:type III secretion YscU/HrpY family protein
MGEKTEKATPKKLRDARKKGQVAKSQDLPSAFTFIVSIAVTLGMANYLYHYMGDFLVSIFQKITDGDLEQVIQAMFLESFKVIFLASMPIMVIVSVVGVLITFLVVGPVFAVEVFKFDPKKFDPIQNLKAKFKLKTLVELIKSIIKISIAAYIIYDVMYNSIPVLIQTAKMPMASALLVFNAFTMEVIIKVGLFFLAVAVLDFAYQKYDFGKEMKMEKFEVKQEYKNTEGDPHIKGKRKQLAQEIAFQEGPSGTIKRAQAVVTNPKHIAIAIGYRPDMDAAPYIVAMGQDHLALQMIKLAEENGIPTVRNIPLAHTLWENGEVWEYVPQDTYPHVAALIRWVQKLGTELEYQYQPELENL